MSQRSEILKFLKQGKRITPMIAYEKFGCLRLSERIRELWIPVYKGWTKVGKKHVMEYWL